MLFPKKRKDMIELKDLQKRMPSMPKQNQEKINPQEFIELPQTKNQGQTTKNQSNANFFGFTAPSAQEPVNSNEQAITNEQAINKQLQTQDSRTTELDNKIYKLEQRIELLEKKLDVNQPNNNVGVMGW